MRKYPTRRATDEDIPFMRMACEQAQVDYWEQVGKRRIEWTPGLVAQLKDVPKFVALSPTSPGPASSEVLVGTLIMHVVNKVAKIFGMATIRSLSEREQRGVALSLLIGGYEETRGEYTRAYGDLEASQTILLSVFDSIDKFQREALGRAPSVTEVKGEPRTFRIEIDPVDDEYLAALKKALGVL